MRVRGSRLAWLNGSWACLACSLVLPSLGLLQKYFGLVGALVYTIVSLFALAWAAVLVYRRIWRAIPDAWLTWLAGLTIMLLLLFVILSYPLANSGRFGGGSDNDEALIIAATELADGSYPYSQYTYLGNRISPMPGAVILALPFVFLGHVGLQNVFWVAIFLWLSGRLYHDRRQALLLLGTILLLSPVIARNLATGADYVANTLYVLAASVWAIEAASYRRDGGWLPFLTAIFLGVTLSSRANFLLLLPLVFAAIYQRSDLATAIRSSTLTLISFLAITLPFYLWNPAEFSPLITYSELAQFDSVLPAAGLFIPALAAASALGLSLRENRTTTSYLGHAAIVLAIPVLAGTLLASVRQGTINLSFLNFGVFFLFFGAAAGWPGVMDAAGIPPASSLGPPMVESEQ